MGMEVLDRGASNVWIRLEGRLDLKGVQDVELPFTVRAARSEKPVVVDLTGVTFVGSLAVGLLFSAARALGLRGAKLYLFGASERVDEVLRTGGLPAVAELLASEDEAARAVGAA